MGYLILHNIRSEENVGSMFRSADAFGIKKIFITGYTPTPLDRFKRPVGKIAKTALGAEKTIPWEQGDIVTVSNKLKVEGVRIVALEQDARSVPLSTYVRNPGFAQEAWALVVGNEVEGVDQETLALCDDVVEIPMQGEKESLNVAVAAGIALYALTTSTPVV
jgi:tRNA G18 (ribose-2'-O)-methylase SpoU